MRQQNSLEKDTIWTSYFSTNSWLTLGIATLSGLLTIWITQEIIMTDHFFYNSLGDQLPSNRIEDILSTQSKWAWLPYLISPCLILLQAILISTCLVTGAFSIDRALSFKQGFRIALHVLAIIGILKLSHSVALCFQEIESIEALLASDWYSLLAIIGKEAVPIWLQPSLMSINIFQIVLILLLAIGIQIHYQFKYRNALGFVLGSYGLGLTMWLVFLAFIQISF